MEAGGKISGKTVIMENPGGGSIHSSQKAGAITTTTTTTTATVAVAAKLPEAKTTTTTTTSAPEKSEEIPAPTKEIFYDVSEKVQAKFSEDGKWYNAVIRGVKGELFNVYYTDYGNSEFVSIASLRKFSPPVDTGKGKPAQKQQYNNRNNASQRNHNRLDR